MKLAESLSGWATLPMLGLGTVAAFVLFPALRPQIAGFIKAGTKLYLEAELGADDALADHLADVTVQELMNISHTLSPQDREQAIERRLAHFASRAQHSARRRGFDAHDVERRYDKRIAKLEHAIGRAKRRARPSQGKALDEAVSSLERHRQQHAHRARRSEPASA